MLLSAVTIRGADESDGGQHALFHGALQDASTLIDGRYESLRYNPAQWYGSTFFTGRDWTRVGKDWQHPGERTPSVRCFVAPQDGRVTVTGRVFKLHQAGDGIRAIVRHNDQQVWQAEIDGTDARGVELDLRLSLRSGDRLRFVVHKRGQISCDTTGWDPVVRYADGTSFRASAAFAAHRQGAEGWRYEQDASTSQSVQTAIVYAWSPDFILQAHPLRPGVPLGLSTILPWVVVADAQDRSGMALGVATTDPGRFLIQLDEQGAIKVHYQAAAERPVLAQRYRGTWPAGWMLVDDWLNSSEADVLGDIDNSGQSLALRAMIQADWWRQDAIDQSGESYQRAVSEQLERTSELVASLRVTYGAGPWDATARELGALGSKLDKGVAVAEAAQQWLALRQLKRRLLLAHPHFDGGPLLVCKRVPPSWSHLVAQYFGWRQRPGGGLYIVPQPGRSLQVRDMLTDQLPPGSVLEPRLSYDGRRMLFAFVACDRRCPIQRRCRSMSKGTGPLLPSL